MIAFDVLGTPVTQGSGGGDVGDALERLRRLIGPDVDPERMVAFVVDGAPVSKSRARWSGKSGRHYTPQKTVNAQSYAAALFRQALGGETFAGAIAIVAIFYRPNYQRIDADNLMKLVMDAGTQAMAWKDDCFVTAQAAFIEMDRAAPRTVVALCQTKSSLDRERMFTCGICSKEFRRAGTATFANPPKFCSRECRYEGYRRDRQPARCPKCETQFERRSSGQRYCSDKCRGEATRIRPPNASLRPKPTCQSCGGPVSRREYLQCANCRPKGRKPGSKNRPVEVMGCGE